MDRKKFTLALSGIAAAAIAVVALAIPGIVDSMAKVESLKKQEQFTNRVVSSVEKVSDAAAHRIETPRRMYRERVDLPTLERGKYWLTFLFPEGWESDPESVRLRNFFTDGVGDPRLIEMRTTTCRVNNYSMLEAKKREQWVKFVGTNAPMIVLQEPSGRLVFKVSAGNIPETSEELVERIQAAVSASRPLGPSAIGSMEPEVKPQPAQPTFIHRRDRRRSDTGEPKLVATLASYNTYERGCRPKPEPVAPVVDTPEFVTPINPIPDTVPADEQQPADNGDPLWLLALLSVLGVSGGAVYSRRKS